MHRCFALTEPSAIVGPVSVKVDFPSLSSLDDQPSSRVRIQIAPDGYGARGINRSYVVSSGSLVSSKFDVRTICKKTLRVSQWWHLKYRSLSHRSRAERVLESQVGRYFLIDYFSEFCLELSHPDRMWRSGVCHSSRSLTRSPRRLSSRNRHFLSCSVPRPAAC